MNESEVVSVRSDRVAHKPKDKKGNGIGVVDPYTPYLVEIDIYGTEMILFHRYDVENVKNQQAAKKGSKEKKTDNIEAYVYRTEKGELCLPGLNFKASICQAAKFAQDPRSPRKSAFDLFRAGIRCRGVAGFGTDKWDFVDVRKVNVQRNGVPRQRPGMNEGWKLKFTIEVLLPEYITPDWLSELVTNAGRLCALGDYRPDFGTFRMTKFEVLVLK